MAIEDYLQTGKQNATSCSELAKQLNTPPRSIHLQITEARLKGVPICASNSGKMGYYIAANVEELQEYCGRIAHRAGEIFAVKSALVKTLNQMEREQGRQLTIYDILNTDNTQ